MPKRRQITDRTTICLKMPPEMPTALTARCKELKLIHDQYINFLLDKDYHVPDTITVDMINSAKNAEYQRNLTIVYLHQLGLTYDAISKLFGVHYTLPQYYFTRFEKAGAPALVPIRNADLVRFAFAVERKTHKRVSEQAAERGYTISRWLRIIIEDDLYNCNKED